MPAPGIDLAVATGVLSTSVGMGVAVRAQAVTATARAANAVTRGHVLNIIIRPLARPAT